MKNQFCFVLGILIFVFVVSAHGAEYSKNNDAFQEVEEEEVMSYIYYEIKINDSSFFCERYELKNGNITMLTMYNVFMEDNNEKYSEIIIISGEIKYIKKKKSVSENDVIKNNKSECFIGTARGK